MTREQLELKLYELRLDAQNVAFAIEMLGSQHPRFDDLHARQAGLDRMIDMTERELAALAEADVLPFVRTAGVAS